MDPYDVVIVGARCAGSPLATMLARQGLAVCVLDQARFPSDTLSTHVVQPHGVELLDRLGALDRMPDDAVSIESLTLVMDDVRIEETQLPGQRPGLSARRVTMDAALVDVARAAGAEVRTATRATGLLRQGDRVVGVETDGGAVCGRLVIGADGRRSSVADWAGSREYHVTPGGRMLALGYFEGVADLEPRLRIGQIGDWAFLAAPTDGGLYMSGVLCDLAAAPAFLADRAASYERGLRAWPELAALVDGRRMVGPLRVQTDWHGFFREAAGPGWVLVGDAGHFKDFTPGQGISDALRQVDRLAPAIVEGFASDREATLDALLQRWWTWRDEDAWEMYWFASDMGAPGPPTPLVTRVLRDISKRPGGGQDLLRMLDHEIPPSALFTRPRLALAAVRALADRPRQARATAREIGASVREQVRRDRLRPGVVPAR